MTDWKIFCSSSVSARKGLPMSLRSADLIVVVADEEGHPRRGRGADHEAGRATLVGEEPRDVHEEDLGAAAALDRLLPERLDARREVERDERAAGEEHAQRRRGQSSHGTSI